MPRNLFASQPSHIQVTSFSSRLPGPAFGWGAEKEITMSHQIIKQPNGLYAVFSSVVDDFILLDATPEDIIQDRVDDYRKQARRDVNRIVAELAQGGKPYHQFTLSFEQAVKDIRRRHGKDAESLRMLRDGGVKV